MKGQSTTGVVIGIIIIIIIIGGIWWYVSQNPATPAPTGTTSAQDMQSVDTTVTNFGKQLQNVSLMGSSTAVVAAMNQYYSPYVSPNLLSQWEASTSTAPGRLVSSPWPDRIDISNTSQNPDGSYTVTGDIAYITSVEQTQGGTATTTPVIVMVSKDQNGNWLISGFQTQQ